LNESVKISWNVLSVLCNIWVERRDGFLLNSEVVPFKLLDVCLGLRSMIVRDGMALDQGNIESVCRNNFSNKKVIVAIIYNYLLKQSECVGVDDFCKFYILIGISDFLLPNRNGTVLGWEFVQCLIGFEEA